MHIFVDFTPFIVHFGINGDGFDRATKQLNSEEDISIHCDTGISGVSINWFFSNGTLIGTTDRNVRQASFPNGTTLLQIANGRALDYCDAGVYTCRAVSSTGEIQERNFRLRVNSKWQVYNVWYGSTLFLIFYNMILTFVTQLSSVNQLSMIHQAWMLIHKST